MDHEWTTGIESLIDVGCSLRAPATGRAQGPPLQDGISGWRRGRDSSTEGKAWGCSAGDQREPTHGPRALAWEGVTGTATNGSQRTPVFKTTAFLQLTTLHNG